MADDEFVSIRFPNPQDGLTAPKTVNRKPAAPRKKAVARALAAPMQSEAVDGFGLSLSVPISTKPKAPRKAAAPRKRRTTDAGKQMDAGDGTEQQGEGVVVKMPRAKKPKKAPQTRQEKALSEKILFLRREDAKKFVVLSQTGSVYRVSANIKKMGCTCPDAQRRRTFCKHSLFVLINILKYAKDASDLTELPPDELKQLVRDCPTAASHECHYCRKALPIARLDGEADIGACFKCSRRFHGECWKRWTDWSHHRHCSACDVILSKEAAPPTGLQAFMAKPVVPAAFAEKTSIESGARSNARQTDHRGETACVVVSIPSAPARQQASVVVNPVRTYQDEGDLNAFG